MVESSDQGAARRAAIVEAAMAVFMRYGFKKTSMDDLARAAGISRQGLYLHFATKEALFKEAVSKVIEGILEAGRAALAREDLELEERLTGLFVAVHGHAVGSAGPEHWTELLEAAAAIVGDAADQLEASLVADLAKALRATGVAAGWKEAGLSAKELAEHLYATSHGAKHQTKSAAAYRDKMRTAVRLVVRGSKR